MGFLSTIFSDKSGLAIEGFGAFMFVLVGTSALTALSVTGQATTAASLLVGTIAFSGVLTWLVYIFGSSQPTQFNPAVTALGMMSGTTPIMRGVWIMFVQFLGAIVASVVVALLYGTAGVEAKIGAPYPMTSMGIFAALFAEFLGTLLLLISISRAEQNMGSPWYRAVMTGAGFGLGFLLSAGISGGGLNPARSIAPQLTAADMTGWWIYIVGPMAAAICVGLATRPNHQSAHQTAKGSADTAVNNQTETVADLPEVSSLPVDHKIPQPTAIDSTPMATPVVSPEDTVAAEPISSSIPRPRTAPAKPSFMTGIVHDEPEEPGPAAEPLELTEPAPIANNAQKPNVKFVNFEIEDQS